MYLLKVRWQLSLVAFSLITLSSCSNYGKKVTFSDHKGEVYYKGEGVSESDAKAVGKFLDEEKYFLHDGQTRSIQITQKDKKIEARFVVNKKKLEEVKNVDGIFEIIGARMSKQVFNNMPVDVIYTDDKFKDIKTIAYNKKVLESNSVLDDLKAMNKKEVFSNTLYYSESISPEEATSLSDYLSAQEFFTKSSNNDFIIEKSGEQEVHIKVPFQTSFLEVDGMQRVKDFAQKMKNELFPDTRLNFEVLDEKMESVKILSY
jgi:hypothetical protein